MAFDSIYEERFHKKFCELLEVIREQDVDMEANDKAYADLFDKYEYALEETERLKEENHSLKQRIAELEANLELLNV